MSLVKSNKRRFPVVGESFMNEEPFFTDLFDPRGRLNLNRLFNGDLKKSFEIPPINVKDQEKSLEMELAAPGLTKDDFNITLDDGILTISSEKEENKEQEEDGYVRKEFSYNSFSRSFSLPENVDESKDVKATYHDGILKIILSKKDDVKPKAPKSVKIS